MANDLEMHSNTAVDKRPYDENENATEKKKQKVTQPISIGNKNPVAYLNEQHGVLTYETVEQYGPPHQPVFKVAVTVNGNTYYGTGGSKKVAKTSAALQVLKNEHYVVPQPNTAPIDFTKDVVDDEDGKDQLQPDLNSKVNGKKNPDKGAVMLLNELFPNIDYECTENVEDVHRRFQIVIHINGKQYTGSGSSKKLAKTACASAAINDMYKIQGGNLLYLNPHFKGIIHSSQHQAFVDKLGMLINDKFTELMKSDTVHAKRKVLAGIVLTKDDQIVKIISICTGTKCLSGERMSMCGAVLKDMHAEILCRRGLKLYLYNQLLMLADPDLANDSILRPSYDRDRFDGYELKDGYDFHIFITSAPCGDARIFSPHEDANHIDRHPNRNSRGQLRKKIESGEGTIPTGRDDDRRASRLLNNNNNVNAAAADGSNAYESAYDRARDLYLEQSWDAILQGSRLLTMSCSDKIARWNVLGLQGSLLSHYIRKPIYLKTIALGSLYNVSHLSRALYGRLDRTLQGLPAPYQLNRPDLCMTTSTETRQPVKSPNFSVSWVTGHAGVEIINASTGKPDLGVSVISKQNLSNKFVEVLRSGLPSWTGVHRRWPEIYGQVKSAANDYNEAKFCVFRAVKAASLGVWIVNTEEEDAFGLYYEGGKPGEVDGGEVASNDDAPNEDQEDFYGGNDEPSEFESFIK